MVRRLVVETDGSKVQVSERSVSDLEMLMIGQLLVKAADEMIQQSAQRPMIVDEKPTGTPDLRIADPTPAEEE